MNERYLQNSFETIANFLPKETRERIALSTYELGMDMNLPELSGEHSKMSVAKEQRVKSAMFARRFRYSIA